MTKCRSYPDADVGLDHELVMAGIRIKLKKRHVEPQEKILTQTNKKTEGSKRSITDNSKKSRIN